MCPGEKAGVSFDAANIFATEYVCKGKNADEKRFSEFPSYINL
jgi:hypothetical protein